MDEQDLQDSLRRRGLTFEEREPSAVENLVGSGLGSLGGQLVAKALRLGWLGAGLAGIAGGAIGLLAVRYRVRWKPGAAEPGVHEGGHAPDGGHVYY